MVSKKEKKKDFLKVKDLLSAKEGALKLEVVYGSQYLDRRISVMDVNRPGLALAGHLENFRAERVQIIGRGEHAYCKKEDPKKLLETLSKMFSSKGDVPCVIITGGLPSLEVLKKACARAKIPLLRTKLDTTGFVGEVLAFLSDQLSPSTHVHGVLVNVYGLGVLIQGDAGVGKSECALELLKRGHILVADDMVEIQRKRGSVLIGNCPSMLRHYMEVRGLGIIDVELLFGVGSVMDTSPVEMSVNLTSVDFSSKCDRTGLEKKTMDILGVDIPSICIPVTPGRNIAVLIEVAALNQRLKFQGICSANEFNNKLIKKMKKN
jgi:HPr kinase/phosphorylase